MSRIAALCGWKRNPAWIDALLGYQWSGRTDAPDGERDPSCSCSGAHPVRVPACRARFGPSWCPHGVRRPGRHAGLRPCGPSGTRVPGHALIRPRHEGPRDWEEVLPELRWRRHAARVLHPRALRERRRAAADDETSGRAPGQPWRLLRHAHGGGRGHHAGPSLSTTPIGRTKPPAEPMARGWRSVALPLPRGRATKPALHLDRPSARRTGRRAFPHGSPYGEEKCIR